MTQITKTAWVLMPAKQFRGRRGWAQDSRHLPARQDPSSLSCLGSTIALLSWSTIHACADYLPMEWDAPGEERTKFTVVDRRTFVWTRLGLATAPLDPLCVRVHGFKFHGFQAHRCGDGSLRRWASSEALQHACMLTAVTGPASMMDRRESCNANEKQIRLTSCILLSTRHASLST